MKINKKEMSWGAALVASVAFLIVLGLTINESMSFFSHPERGQTIYALDTASLDRIEVPGFGEIEYQRLFEEISQPGEDLDAFILRLGPRMRAFTDRAGFEACGLLATDGQRFGVVVGSTLAHAACGSFLEAVPEGMTPTGETVHSHRAGGVYRANESDHILTGVRVGARFSAGSPDEFSREDYHTPGYLVGARGVWHQAGRRSVRQVGQL